MEELENAWQNLDIDAYIDMLYDQGDIFYKMEVFDFQEDLVITLDERSVLEVMPHFADGMFFGWNVYSRTVNGLELIDTFDTKDEGEMLIQSLNVAMGARLPLFRLPY